MACCRKRAFVTDFRGGFDNFFCLAVQVNPPRRKFIYIVQINLLLVYNLFVSQK